MRWPESKADDGKNKTRPPPPPRNRRRRLELCILQWTRCGRCRHIPLCRTTGIHTHIGMKRRGKAKNDALGGGGENNNSFSSYAATIIGRLEDTIINPFFHPPSQTDSGLAYGETGVDESGLPHFFLFHRLSGHFLQPIEKNTNHNLGLMRVYEMRLCSTPTNETDEGARHKW